jgi:polyphosphate kinase 2
MNLPPAPPPGEVEERIRREVLDALDEEFELELEDRDEPRSSGASSKENGGPLGRGQYFRELLHLQGELIKLQDWIVASKSKLVVLFEGRDAAGKGGAIKRITQRLNPRVCRVAALPAPTEREKTQWYFQRYVSHLPAAGEIVLFDRSWYNRAGVERVMGFCTDAEREEFFRSVPDFERMLIHSGIRLVKYWFSISDEEQEFRFNRRLHDPLKQWKLSTMDVESRRRWEDYTAAKEDMLKRTHTADSPWWVVQANDKKRARLNCIHHLLKLLPYHEVAHPPIALPSRIHHPDYHRHPLPSEMFVPEAF